jgi:hypothetical protein
MLFKWRTRVKHLQERMVMEKLLSPAEVADITGLTTGTLAQMRYLGTGPAYRRLSAKTIRYSVSDVESFVASARRVSTREPAIA